MVIDPEDLYAQLAGGDAGRIRTAAEPVTAAMSALSQAGTSLEGGGSTAASGWQGAAADSFAARSSLSGTATSTAHARLEQAAKVIEAAAGAYGTMRGAADNAIAAWRSRPAGLDASAQAALADRVNQAHDHRARRLRADPARVRRLARRDQAGVRRGRRRGRGLAADGAADRPVRAAARVGPAAGRRVVEGTVPGGARPAAGHAVRRPRPAARPAGGGARHREPAADRRGPGAARRVEVRHWTRRSRSGRASWGWTRRTRARCGPTRRWRTCWTSART